MKSLRWCGATVALLACSVLAQTPAGSADGANLPKLPVSTLRVTSRAVLVDVIVTDKDGNPVKGLSKDDFTISEDGKPQRVSYFEENRSNPYATPVKSLNLPPNQFCNYSPLPPQPAVNVLLLDSLNTPMQDQTYVHEQALRFMRGVHPGTRMAIFTMSLGLHFVQGFTDDPAMLLSALNDGKNNEIEVPSLVKSYEETGAQTAILEIMARPMPFGPNAQTTSASPAMIAALSDFFQETGAAQETDRAYRTLENLQKLAQFLSAFPGRKNLIWFSEQFPDRLFGDSSQRLDDQIRKTVNMLTAARIAVYPVDARGSKQLHFYEAANTTQFRVNSTGEVMGGGSAQATSVMNESLQRDSDQETMAMLARDSGGKVFRNTNGLAGVIAEVSQSSNDFYSLSYAPTNSKMDGQFRHILVKVNGGNYGLSYRRGYYATDLGLPGAVEQEADAGQPEAKRAHAPGPAKSAVHDPLSPFMDMGMPQSDQILYKLLVEPQASGSAAADGAEKDGKNMNYALNFAIDLHDLHLNTAASGMHEGTVYVEFRIYDRYGELMGNEEHLVKLRVPQEAFEADEKVGVQMRANLRVPRHGHYWLRTGVYDAQTHHVGTMEIPLDLVRPSEMASR